MLSAIDAVRAAGVEIAPMDVWSRDGAFDILQLWGLEDAHLSAATWGRRAGKRVVLSALLPYLGSRTFVRNLGGRLMGFKRTQMKILSLVDHLVVVNQNQAFAAERLLNFPGDRISVIPNIVEDIYFNDNRVVAGRDFGIEGYLVCTGNICRRKNQLALAQAAIREDAYLLIVGSPLAGEEDYADALAKLILKSEKVKWLRELPAHSPEMRAAYQNSIGFVLISIDETQPISALEAAAMGKPLLLSDMAWAKQSFYRGACLVNPSSLTSIQEGMRRILDRPDIFKVGSGELEKCRRQRVGEAYASVYAQVIAQTA